VSSHPDQNYRLDQGLPFTSDEPNILPVPEEVIKAFQDPDRTVFLYRGMVCKRNYSAYGVHWYNCSTDFTSLVQQVLARAEIQETFSALERAVERELPTSALLSLPGFRGGITAGEYKGLSLDIRDFYRSPEEESKFPHHGECSISLWDAEKRGSVSVSALDLPVAKLGYVGKLREK
jgi:hypothetical protein